MEEKDQRGDGGEKPDLFKVSEEGRALKPDRKGEKKEVGLRSPRSKFVPVTWAGLFKATSRDGDRRSSKILMEKIKKIEENTKGRVTIAEADMEEARKDCNPMLYGKFFGKEQVPWRVEELVRMIKDLEAMVEVKSWMHLRRNRNEVAHVLAKNACDNSVDE
ncbi:hypothetical protein Cni_G05348 [Canna indica]|uniref:Uncharacterized protein n=1 Tax=Canna indica TaxID=4628 RepID=A0AAQ3JXL8_9LILI|nr:hypothetical protein Cni_G05348 [Canna indica]